MSGLTIQTKVHFRRGRRSRKELCPGEDRKPVSPGRIPRLSRLMALAIRIEDLVRDGAVPDYAAAARLAHITRARMTQITNLLLLAPAIQEAILDLPLVTNGRDPVSERALRRIVAEPDWDEQRALWSEVQRCEG